MGIRLTKLIMAAAGTAVVVVSMAHLGPGPAVARPAASEGGSNFNGFPLPPGPPQVGTRAGNGDVACSRDDAPGDWVTWCRREPNDGDDGGVSGFANVHSTRVAAHADIEFRALGEKLYLDADTGLETHFGLYVWRGSRWELAFRHTETDGNIDKDLSLSIPDGLYVYLGVCTDDGRKCAGLSSLRA